MKNRKRGKYMPIDCEELSPNALKIFKELERFFGPDPWNKPQWLEEGKVYDNGWFDLCKSDDRKRLQEKQKNMIGYCIAGIARIHQRQRHSLEGLANICIGSSVESYVTLLVLLEDLDFQIETMDFCEN